MHTTVTADGSQDWSEGVNSLAVTTVQSAKNPNGLKRTQLAWLQNATVRDGGISPRAAYQYLAHIASSAQLFQGMFMYEPFNGDPYVVVAISGHILKVITTPPFTVTDLSVQFGLFMPATEPYFFFVQAEEFLVIQAGDLVTLPLFWSEGDGNPALLRRSKGITNPVVAPGTPGVNEIPAAGAMDYYQNRLWYAQGRQYSAGDIVGGPSGTAAFSFRDSVLNVTENPLCVGGDGFTIPTQSGNIRALTHNANINATLGQGQLLPGTRKAVYALIVPITRTDWIAAGNNNQPEQLVIQLVNGPVNDRSVVKINGDLFFNSLEPDIRSLFASVRNWTQPGNISIAKQENRLLQFNDRSLLRFTSGVVWDNRILMGELPKQLPQGVVTPALAPLDFVPISSLGGSLQPVWEGTREGLQILQMGSADFGGLERAFAISVSAIDGSIELWEFTKTGRFDINRFGESRITWIIETPAFTHGNEDELKKLVSAEFGIDRVVGEVIVKVEYRPDSDTCYHPWSEFKLCALKTSEPNVLEPDPYPPPELGPCYRSSVVLPVPPATCSPCGNKRPSNIAFQQQLRITVKGYARIRKIVLWAEPVEQALYDNLVPC